MILPLYLAYLAYLAWVLGPILQKRHGQTGKNPKKSNKSNKLSRKHDLHKRKVWKKNRIIYYGEDKTEGDLVAVFNYEKDGCKGEADRSLHVSRGDR